MPHSVSAKKSMRQNERRRLRNRPKLSALRTQLKKSLQAVDSGDSAQAAAELKIAQSALDKTAAKGLIHRNTAARTKGRLAKRLNAMAAPKTE